MSLKSLEKLEGLAGNRYAAVLIAAKWARKLNEKRLKEQEQLVDEEEKAKNPSDKVMLKALDELLQGKITFDYPKE
jgi:DNA-directed RNA polymerase omega subunit